MINKVGRFFLAKGVKFVWLFHPQIIDFVGLVIRWLSDVSEALRCVRDFNLHNQEISQSCNMLIIIKLLQINYITKYH